MTCGFAHNVTASFPTFSASTFEATITNMTTAGHATYVDALVCPYTSGNTIKCINAVNPAYTGPVIAWGGASNTIFDSTCKGKNFKCFGFFTPASKYTETGLVALAGQMSAAGKVALITNDNSFSTSVTAGTNTTIAAHSAKFSVQSSTTVTRGGLTAAEKTAIQQAMSHNPDIVVISGHNGDVEPAIIEIGKNGVYPKAILATNGLSKLDNYKTPDDKYSKCILMPTQWDD